MSTLIRRCYFAGRKLRLEIHEGSDAPYSPTHTPITIKVFAGGLTMEWAQGVPGQDSIDGNATIESAISFLTSGSCGWSDESELDLANAICDACGGADTLSCEAEYRFSKDVR